MLSLGRRNFFPIDAERSFFANFRPMKQTSVPRNRQKFAADRRTKNLIEIRFFRIFNLQPKIAFRIQTVDILAEKNSTLGRQNPNANKIRIKIGKIFGAAFEKKNFSDRDVNQMNFLRNSDRMPSIISNKPSGPGPFSTSHVRICFDLRMKFRFESRRVFPTLKKFFSVSRIKF